MILHISHNDLDGIGCGIIVKNCIPSVHTIYTNYDDLENILKDIPIEYSTVIITDLGPSKSTLEMLAGEKEVVLIDHHKSTLGYKEYPFTIHSIDMCATKLTYDYFSKQGHDLSAYENFVDCVDDFDLWKMNRTDSLQMNILLRLLGRVRFEKRFLDYPYKQFDKTEELLISLEEEKRDAYLKIAEKSMMLHKDINNNTFAFVFAENYASELGNYILQESSAEYVLIINAQRKKASLRSVGDMDVSLIAERNGGGGHKNAAGFSISTDLGENELLKQIGIIG